jgi:acyl transferase domain-containing protein
MTTARPDTELSPLKRALLALDRMQAKLDAAERSRHEPIAVIGLGCRFPGGGDSADSFWRLLRSGTDVISEVPADRWDIDAYYSPDPDAPGKMCTRWGGFLDGIDQFDPQFFGITPREAASLDPQQRLLLEVAWEALEHAGQAPDRLKGSRTGVFVGVLGTDYQDLQLAGDGANRIDAYFGSGTARSMASGRLSYFLGLQGPSVSIDTACSSSLVALHLACVSLRVGESRLALAAGVNLILTPQPTIALSRYHMMALDGRCKTFDKRADGYVRGEGCAVLVLKTLSAALADGDRVLAVIRGTAINQDGASSGLTAPNGPAQEAVIRDALADAALPADEVTYVETHGTGTSLGDPIEVQALANVLAPNRTADRPVYVGTVKANIGHTEATAGLAGVIKAILCLQHREIPPHLHLQEQNPFIPWDRIPVHIPRVLTPWPKGAPLVAGVSSFGFSGTNVHAVLTAAPEADRRSNEIERPLHILTISSAAEETLRTAALRYADHLQADAERSRWPDVCHTAAVGRAHLSHRLAIAAADAAEAATCLRQFARADAQTTIRHGVVRTSERAPVAWLFTGQGAQYSGMGRQLYRSQPTFRRTLDRCADLLRSEANIALLDVMHGDGADQRLQQTAFTQPALFSLECALADMWRSWGVEPSAVLGHSVGEYVAAYVAGIFSLEDGLRLVSARARLMQSLPPGGEMVAVLAGAPRVTELLARHRSDVAIAAINAPESTVISGSARALAPVLDALARMDIAFRPLQVSHAFHSPLMDPILEEFERVAGAVTYAAPRIRLISNLTGSVAKDGIATTARYWRDHLRQPVRFAAGVQELERQGFRLFLELGPGGVLAALGRLTAKGCTFVPTLRSDADEWRQTLDALAVLHVEGAGIDWRGFDGDYVRRRVTLPNVPFQRSRHWVRTAPARAVAAHAAVDPAPVLHPLLHRRIASPLGPRQFESTLDPSRLAVIEDHKVLGTAILPATAFIEIALAAATRDQRTAPPPAIDGLVIHDPLPFPDGAPRTVHTVLSPSDGGAMRFEIFSLAAGGQNAGASEWIRHVQGTVAPAELDATEIVDIDSVRTRCTTQVDARQHYAELERRGYTFGPALQGVERVWVGAAEALARIRLPASDEPLEGYLAPPALLDACLQFCWTLLADRHGEHTYLPLSVNTIRIRSPLPTRVWSRIVLRGAEAHDAPTFTADVQVLEDTGAVLAELSGVLFRRVGRDVLKRAFGARTDDWLYQLRWDRKPLPSIRVEVAEPVQTTRVSLAAIRGAVDTRLPELASAHGLAAHREVFVKLERLSTGYVTHAFERLGLVFTPGARLTQTGIATELRVLPKYGRLLGRLLGMLDEDGVLERRNDEWVVRRAPAAIDREALRKALADGYPAAAAQLELTVRCGEKLADAITGKVDPLSLLFPGGSLELAERLYREQPEAKVFNELAATAVAAAVRQLPSDRPIKVIELGAGTGGMTGSVLPHLPADRTEYWFTDVSPAFLARARRKFEGYSFIQYGLCNAERSGDDQGYEPGRFDLVVAANALHATGDLRRTMTNARRMLAPHGVLVLLEGTNPERWIDITFGLTDGWWAFSDTALRPTYPLLTRESWSTLLTEVGFDGVLPAPSSADLSHQAVVVARNGGDSVTRESHVARSGVQDVWAVLADRTDLAEALAGRLSAHGRRCHVLMVGEGKSDAPGAGGAAATSTDVVADALRAAGPIRGVVYAAALDAAAPSLDPAASLEPTEQRICGGLLALVQALASGAAGEGPRLCVVTHGAQAARSEDTLAPAQAALLGLSKVIDLEHPELACMRIDLDPAQPALQQADRVARELVAADGENQIAYRADERFVLRLVRSAAPADAPARPTLPAGAVRLRSSVTGVLDELSWAPVGRRAPADTEVEIEVRASGLAFRDVMNALAMRSDEDPLGSEVSGVITAVGARVQGFAVGDSVVALAPGSLASFVIADAALVAHKPAHLGFEAAATLPTAMTTAYHALANVARLRRGERVLIHAAAGGVGLAAVQIAKRAGAEIIATAGSEAKRAFLRGLGIRHVYSSRTIAFSDQVLEATAGRGVDVVLNSLAGDFIPASVAALARGGRFLEIGKRDIWSTEQMARARPDVVYSILDLAASGAASREVLERVFREVMTLAAAGEIAALPLRVFAWSETPAAFRHMAQARHIGKIVIAEPRDEPQPGRFRADATYLITGGLAGLGLLTATWLVERGARHLLLIARSEPSAPARAAIEAMEANGARVVTARGDVSDAAQLKAILTDAARSMPPLRGIVHSAGVLDDAVLMRQDWSRFWRVMAAKVNGAWNLHALTLNEPLDFFVLYSSVAGLLGSSGQANHAAANAFMDALAHERCARGWPALSINWGVWSEIGSAAERGAVERVGRQGVATISPGQGLAVLEQLLRHNGAQVAVLPVDWPQYLRQFRNAPLWLSEAAGGARGTSPAPVAASARQQAGTLRQRLDGVPQNRRAAVVEAHVVREVASVIGLDPSRTIDPELPLNEIGLDSLMAVELRNRLGATLGVKRQLPATLVFDYPSIAAIASYLLSDVLELAARDREPVPQKTDPTALDVLSAIEQLSDDSVETMLSGEHE